MFTSLWWHMRGGKCLHHLLFADASQFSFGGIDLSHLSKMQLWLLKLFVWYSSLYCAWKELSLMLTTLFSSDFSHIMSPITLVCTVGQVSCLPSLLLLKPGEFFLFLQEMHFWNKWKRVVSVGWSLQESSSPTARPFQGWPKLTARH